MSSFLPFPLPNPIPQSDLSLRRALTTLVCVCLVTGLSACSSQGSKIESTGVVGDRNYQPAGGAFVSSTSKDPETRDEKKHSHEEQLAIQREVIRRQQLKLQEQERQKLELQRQKEFNERLKEYQ